MKRVIIADEHPVVRMGVSHVLLNSNQSIEFVECSSGQDVLDTLNRESWDLIIMDIVFSDLNGVELIRQIRQQNQNIPILILSLFPEKPNAVRAIKAGANGYIKKECSTEELSAAVNKLLTGGRYISSELAEQMLTELKDGTEKLPHERLSRREDQIFHMIASGMPPRVIAENLGLSVKTISAHRKRILTKTGLKTNAEIMYYAIKNNLIPDKETPTY